LVLGPLEKKRKISRLSKNIITALVAILIFIAGATAGYYITKDFVRQSFYVSELTVTGDVVESLKIDGQSLINHQEKISYDGKKAQALSLKKIMSLAEPAGSEYSIYLIAGDGKTAKLSSQKLEKSFISYGVENGWEAINFCHPASANIKEIMEVIVVLEGEDMNYSLNIIDMDKNIASITPGQVNLSASRLLKYAGTSFRDVEDERYETSTFELKHIFKLENFLESAIPEKMVVMGSQGQYRFVDNSGYFELDGNVFNYVDTTAGDKTSDLKGIILDPSAASIMDVYYDATGFIYSGKNVMLIITDGLGYHQFKYAVSNGHAPFTASREGAKKALSVYKPVSNSGLAAMFTGKSPEENGIYSRKQREPLIPTVFGELLESGKKTIFIEGDIQILKLEIESMLNTDKNSNGTIDDEIFDAAMSSLDQGNSFIAVHFHSIDDAAHNSGVFSDEAMEKIQTIDSYIEQLSSKWQGKIIITSDHGMHDTAEGGNHGEFRFEDMIVPYIIIDGDL
jgi:hypothetical protein